MIDNPKLSIIIPVYNGEAYIDRIINCIIKHNDGADFSYEILLIDDGSKDNTVIICNQFLKMYDCISYFYKENGGIADARNYGLQVARGEYVTFADQDDEILQSYSSFIEQCDALNLDFLITSPYNRRVDNDNISLRRFTNQLITNPNALKKIAGKLIDGKYLSDESVPFLSTSVWNVIYRRRFLVEKQLRFKAFIDYEDDWIFNIETLMKAKRVAISSEGYYCWIRHNESESHKKKYIPDLINKRSLWMQWLYTILSDLQVAEAKRNEFLNNVIIPRNIMICFNNACSNAESSDLEILSEIKAIREVWDINTVRIRDVDEMDRVNLLLLFMLKQNYIKAAYTLNRKILKQRFH